MASRTSPEEARRRRIELIEHLHRNDRVFKNLVLDLLAMAKTPQTHNTNLPVTAHDVAPLGAIVKCGGRVGWDQAVDEFHAWLVGSADPDALVKAVEALLKSQMVTIPTPQPGPQLLPDDPFTWTAEQVCNLWLPHVYQKYSRVFQDVTGPKLMTSITNSDLAAKIPDPTVADLIFAEILALREAKARYLPSREIFLPTDLAGDSKTVDPVSHANQLKRRSRHGEAARVLQNAADTGDNDALCDLAELYLYGWGVAEDRAKARSLFERAANSGHSGGKGGLGWMLLFGWGGPRDDLKGTRLLAEAIADNSAEGFYGMGGAYLYGRRVPQNHARAAELYEKAMMLGHSGAANFLGTLYSSGKGVRQDYRRAAELFQWAADRGNPHAMQNLAEMLVTGQGVAENVGKGMDLYERANAAAVSARAV